MTSTLKSAFQLFPKPNRGLLKASDYPVIWAGVTPSSTDTLRRLLEDNHKNWHVYLNNKGFHNHTAHIVLALWSLGAHESVIEAAFDLSVSIQRPAFTSPGVIDSENWKEHLGDENYYDSYLKFFIDEVRTKGAAASLEEYVFSVDANVGNEEPAMVSRFVDGLVHPLIHTGYGFEFGMPGMVAEGLAQTAVHHTKSWKIIPRSLFQHTVARLTSKLGETVGLEDSTAKKPVHALTILARIVADPRFGGQNPVVPMVIYETAYDKHGDVINAYVDQWTLEGPIEKKIEELVWTCTVIYGIGGFQEGKHFNADFFQLHFVTSSLFLSFLVNQLSRSSQEILLRSYLATILVWYIGRGRAPINIANFYEKAPTTPALFGTAPSPHKSSFPSPTSEYAVTPNPWLPILQNTIVHPDDHLAKLQRSLAHFAGIYGLSSPGCFADVELKDADKLDGTLFIRTAILTAARFGWVRDGEAQRDVDRKGFYSNV
ncbi:hypothetical protein BDQ17DRAFT_1311205 [Cyathus striatus]|nr:hypothetical protein BDQ17DRAFT_1311205 [Cyathus striatus]